MTKLKVDGRTYNSTEAEVQAVALSLTKTFLRPKAARDDKRQAGTRKKRQRWPEVNDWIDAQLRRDPNAKSPDLWQRRPDYIRDPHGCDPISVRTFEARVTERRKFALK